MCGTAKFREETSKKQRGRSGAAASMLSKPAGRGKLLLCSAPRALGRCRGSATVTVSEEFRAPGVLPAARSRRLTPRMQARPRPRAADRAARPPSLWSRERAGTAGRSQWRRRHVLGGQRAGAAAPRYVVPGRRGAVSSSSQGGRKRASFACMPGLPGRSRRFGTFDHNLLIDHSRKRQDGSKTPLPFRISGDSGPDLR